MFQDDDDDDKKEKDDLAEDVHELMDEFDLDEREAKKVEKLEDEGYDEEDALAKAQE